MASMEVHENKNVSVVSCYYRVKSKHSFEDYSRWIINLLYTLQSNIIIFTSKELEESLYAIAMQNRQHPDANTNVKIIVRELHELDIVKKYPDIWDMQYMKDPTRHIRTKECYMIWNSKMSLVKEAIELNPFGSDKFVWNDIGSMRDVRFIHENYENYKQYPKYDNISNDKLDIVLVENFNVPNQIFFQNEIHLSGAIFGGGRDIFLKMIDLFYKYFELYLGRGYFIGCDQQMLATCFQLHPDLFNIILPDMDDKYIDKWFYLYYHYSK